MMHNKVLFHWCCCCWYSWTGCWLPYRSTDGVCRLTSC